MSKQYIGKRTPTAYYIHVSQLSSLSNEEQATIIKGLDRAGLKTDSEFNVLKLSNDLSSLSFLNYPKFFDEGFPELESSWHVDFKLDKCTFRTYSNSFNPPILHRKELLLSENHPQRECFTNLTKEAENLGLFKDVSRIGFRNQWEKLVNISPFDKSNETFFNLVFVVRFFTVKTFSLFAIKVLSKDDSTALPTISFTKISSDV